MSLLERINNRILIIERIKQKEAIREKLKIEWETDPNKIQFEKLRSYDSMKDCFNSEILRIEEHDLTSHEYIDVFIGDTQSHMEMIDILLNGGKLIPPSTIEGYAIVDGEEKMVRPSKNMGLNDGTHRCNLAKYFGLKTIPVVVFKIFDGYWFTHGLWSFEETKIREEYQLNGKTLYSEHRGIKAISKSGKIFIFKDYGYEASVSDSSSEFIIIHIPNNKNYVRN